MSVIPKAYYRFPGKQMCRVEVVRNIMFDLCYNWGGLYERNYCITEESAFDYCLGYDNGYNS